MKIINKKKFAILAIVFLGSFILFNCNEDKLTQINPNRIAEDNFWNNESDARKGIIGAYSPLVSILHYNRFHIFFSDYRDDTVNPNNVSPRTLGAIFQGDSNWGNTLNLWISAYQGISRANDVIENVPDIDMDEDTKNAILGEAYFLRAFNHFDLAMNFRNIPLALSTDSGIDAASTFQATQEEAFGQIIEDFKQAESLLPDSWSGQDKGRAFKASAQAYLGKAYLYQADLFTNDYSKAIEVFNRLQSENSQIELVDNYADNFREETENNKESLFEIQFFNDGNTAWGTDNADSRKSNNFTEDIAPNGPEKFGYSGQDSMEINSWVLDLFLDEQTINGEIDPRAYSTIMFNSDETTNYEGEVLASTFYDGKTYAEAFPTIPNGTTVFGKKFLQVDKSSRAFFNTSSNNLRLMRYADVLLMLAEAEFKNNSNSANQAAVDAINEVRRRADMSEFTIGDLTMQDIMDERVKELTLERSRYFDLVRWDMVKERIVDIPGIKSNAVGEGGLKSYQEGREYFDIPQRELNTYSNFKNNPGY